MTEPTYSVQIDIPGWMMREYMAARPRTEADVRGFVRSEYTAFADAMAKQIMQDFESKQGAFA